MWDFSISCHQFYNHAGLGNYPLRAYITVLKKWLFCSCLGFHWLLPPPVIHSLRISTSLYHLFPSSLKIPQYLSLKTNHLLSIALAPVPSIIYFSLSVCREPVKMVIYFPTEDFFPCYAIPDNCKINTYFCRADLLDCSWCDIGF